MLEQTIGDPWEKVNPAVNPGFRPTAAALLFNREGLVLVNHENARHDQYIPVQGGVDEDESVGAAIEREAWSEVRARIIPPSLIFLGDRVNREGPVSRGEPPKWTLWVFARIEDLPLSADGVEIHDSCIARSAGEMSYYLSRMSPTKAAMTRDALERAYYLRLAPWYVPDHKHSVGEAA